MIDTTDICCCRYIATQPTEFEEMGIELLNYDSKY